MENATRAYYDKRGEVLVKNLRRRHFDAYYCADRAAALSKVLELIPEGSTVLLEDLVNLMANEMFDSGDVERIVPALEALAKKCRHLVMVTNDVFSDGVAYAESTQAYLRQLAAINMKAAQLADCVVEVVYSIPLCVKGELPCV